MQLLPNVKQLGVNNNNTNYMVRCFLTGSEQVVTLPSRVAMRLKEADPLDLIARKPSGLDFTLFDEEEEVGRNLGKVMLGIAFQNSYEVQKPAALCAGAAASAVIALCAINQAEYPWAMGRISFVFETMWKAYRENTLSADEAAVGALLGISLPQLRKFQSSSEFKEARKMLFLAQAYHSLVYGGDDKDSLEFRKIAYNLGESSVALALEFARITKVLGWTLTREERQQLHQKYDGAFARLVMGLSKDPQE